MFKFFHRGFDFSRKIRCRDFLKRFFLSNAYKCTEAWENRLKHPVCQKIDFENLYYNLDLNFQSHKRINVLDIDLFATSLTDCGQFKTELEDILSRLRETPECILLPERTTHAVLRLYMDGAPKQDLFNILSNRLMYGVFPDNYLCNLLMDKFLKENDSVSAVKIAVLQMLQEDTDHPITRALALYCCYNYLESSEVWETYLSKGENEVEGSDGDEEEEQKVRVKYLRNPYYDDHFDITDVNHLIGKTLWMYGTSVGGDLGISSQLVGFVLHEKYDKANAFLENAIKSDQKIHSDAVKISEDIIKKKLSKEKSPGKEGDTSSEDKKAKAQSSGEPEQPKTKIEDSMWGTVLNTLKKIKKQNLIEGNLKAESEKAVKSAVKSNEKKDIELQCQMYKKWEQDRLDQIEYEIERTKIEKVKLEIEKVKEDLKTQEQKLFYFDKEDELELKIIEKEKEKESVVFYKEKGAKKGGKETEYNPPDIHKKKN